MDEQAAVGKPLAARASKITKRIAKWQETFLRALSQTPSVKHACQSAGINRTTAYEHRKKDPAFAQRWADALGHSIDDLEARAFKIALEGNDAVASGLIQWLLRCHRPERYRETSRSEIAMLAQVIFIPQKAEGAE